MGGAKSTDRPAEPHIALAIMLRLAAALSLAVMFAGVKWVSQRGVSVVESLFYRQLGTALCAAIWVAL
ncbi:MAG TPA: EamA/RhaT family transporter, partial [Sphingomicrobium sp.]|nr:EamA/RhaT family transporter [Sphingomicrobium sp.]